MLACSLSRHAAGKMGHNGITKQCTGQAIVFHVFIYQQQLVSFNTTSEKLYKIWVLQGRYHPYLIYEFTVPLF